MDISSLGQSDPQVRPWWRRPSRHRKPRSDRRARPLVFETLETRLVPAGFWTALSHPPVEGIGTMMLLSDGTVLAQGDGGPTGVSKNWYKLTPDSSNMGSYVTGTWTSVASMHLDRLYYGSNMLPDGRVFVLGGEYSGNRGQQNFTNTGEIYDPLANAWTNITPFPQFEFGDDPTEVLPDGRILAGYFFGPQTHIYDPATNTWDAQPQDRATKLRNDRSDEESWVKLPNGSIVSYDIFSAPTPPPMSQYHSQRYNPSTKSWVDAGLVPVPLSSTAVGDELGPAFLMPNGQAFFIGAGYQDPMTGVITANTAFYNPANNTWTAGPVVPNQLGADDAPGAMMPNGHVLFAADHVIPHIFTGPTSIFEFDPAAPPTTAYTDVTPSSSIIDLRDPAYVTRMLMLPNGQVLLSNGHRQLAVYTPQGGPNNAWRPTITGITTDDHGTYTTYTLTGTQLNGISEGAAYGDDAEMSTNYPIVQLKPTNTNDHHVYYGRTFNWSSTGVATGSTPETTDFTLPGALPEGAYNLTVIANGIASTATRFTYSLATHFSVTPSVGSVTANTPITVTVRALGITNQTITSYRGTVHFDSNDFQASLPADYTFTAADNGVHTFTVTLRTAGTDHIVATDTVIGLNGQAAVMVTAAGVDHLAVSTTAANPDIAGTRFDVTVTAQDAYNNTVTAYTGLVTFTSTDPRATLPLNYTFTVADRGVHTYTDTGRGETTLFTTGSETITAIGVANGISGTAIVNVVGVTHFSVTPSANSVTAGASFTVTVRALNAADQTDTGYRSTVHFTSDDTQASLPGDYTFTAADNGVHTFTVTLRTVGPHQIAVTDTGNGSITGSTSVTVTPTTGDHFTVSTTAANPQVAGTPFDVTVTAQDAYGNIATGYTGTVMFSSRDPHSANLPPNYTFTAADNGVHTFPAGATLFTAGTWDVTATDTTSGISGTVNVTVSAAPAVLFQVMAPASTVAGTPFDVTVTTVDPYGNTDTNYTGTVTFSSRDPHPANLPPNYTFTAGDTGVHTFVAGATLFTAGTWDVTAADTISGISGTVNVDVSAAPAVAFQVMAPATVVSGTPFDVTVTAVDPYGNTDTNYTGTVTFTTTDSDLGVVLPADYTFTAGDAGVHTFTDTGLGEITLITPGDQMLTVTDTTDDTITGSATITVMPGPGPNRRQDLVGLGLAVTPALSRPALAPVSLAVTDLDHAGLDRFFSAAGSDAGWARRASSRPRVFPFS